jgi:hypothetical protein
MYQRGDWVRVEGYGGRVAILRVWESLGGGLALCSEAGYQRMSRGEDAPEVGFPLSDVKGVVSDTGQAGERDATTVMMP